MCKSPFKNIAYRFILISPVLPSMYCSSYFNGFWDGRKVTVQLLFCWVLFPEFVKTACSILLEFPTSFSARGFSLCVYAVKTEFMCFKQDGAISILNGKPLKFDQITHLSHNISSTESDINTRIGKTFIHRMSIIWKSGLW